VRHRQPTLFLRLLLLTLPVECVILALFGVWLVRGIERREKTSLDQGLRIQSRELLAHGVLDARRGLRVDTSLIQVPPGTSACLLDAKGAILWEFPQGWFEDSGLRPYAMEDLEIVRSMPVRGAECRVLDAAKRVRTPEDTDFATGPLIEVMLVQPLAGLEQSNREFRQKATAAGVVLLVLTGFLLWASIGAGLSPVRAMMRRLQDVPGPAGTERLDESLVLRELRPLAAEINGLQDRLWGLVQLERRFTAEAAHELRTPLTLVKGTLQTALLTARSPEDYSRALQEALEDLQRLETTAESLLVLARTDALYESPPPPFQEIPLHDFLRAVAERFASVAARSSLRITLDLNPSVIRGDPGAMERLFVNLVDNAVRYARPGGAITLRCAPEGASAVAAVEDTGPAIPDAERPHLFEQFFRGSSGRASRVQGGGLGLCIASSMARLHGAELTYEPCPPDGNRFVVRFSPPT
jgi:signal transduction histidine kinase